MLARKKDGAWGWVIVASVLLSQALLGGICLSGGMFFVIFQDALNSSTITTSWLCSLPITMWFCATPIGSVLTNKYGYRTCSFIGGIMAATGLSLCYFASNIGFLFLSFGTLTGLGFGVNYTGCMAALNVYFDKYKTIASGIVSIGHNLGLIVYSKFIMYLSEEYGWKGSMLIHGAIVFNLCLFATLMSPLDPQLKARAKSHSNSSGKKDLTLLSGSKNSHITKNLVYGSKLLDTITEKIGSGSSLKINSDQLKPLTLNDKTDEQESSETESHQSDNNNDRKWSRLGMFRKSDFCCFCASNILCNLSQGIYILHLPPYATEIGFSREDFSLVLTTYGAVNIVGKVFYSFLGQHPKVDVTFTYTISLTFTGLCMSLTPVFLSRTGMLTLSGFVGFFYCVTGALTFAVVFHIVGYEDFASGLGLSLPFKATGNLIGGPLGGTLYALTGDYRTSFYIAGASMVLSSALMVQPVLKHIRNRRPDPKDIERQRHKLSVYESELHAEHDSKCPVQHRNY